MLKYHRSEIILINDEQFYVSFNRSLNELRFHGVGTESLYCFT